MNTLIKRSVAVVGLSIAMIASMQAYAGNDRLSQDALERARAELLREKCMDEHGNCIQSLMAGSNSLYKCKMVGKVTTDTWFMRCNLPS